MRLIAHFVGTADEPILYQAVRRAFHWTQDVSVVLDGAATDKDVSELPEHTATWRIDEKLDVHEGNARTAAWKAMEEMMDPQDGDYIILLEPDEIVVEHDVLRERLKLADGGVYPILLHQMWTETEFRVDGLYRPTPFQAVVPWRPGGRMRNRPTASGREPTYVFSDRTLHKTNRVICNVLSYAHLAEDYRSRAAGLAEVYLSSSVVTKEWTGGGLL